jgi:anti-sigma28 factor (negative regulator of flagellin synthesis)
MISRVTTQQVLNRHGIQENTQSKNSIKTEASKESDKIAHIKEQIEEGSYKIDIEKTARKIAEELL